MTEPANDQQWLLGLCGVLFGHLQVRTNHCPYSDCSLQSTKALSGGKLTAQVEALA